MNSLEQAARALALESAFSAVCQAIHEKKAATLAWCDAIDTGDAAAIEGAAAARSTARAAYESAVSTYWSTVRGVR